MARSLDQYQKLSIRALSNRVFIFDTSTSDERYFRDQLFELVKGKRSLGNSFRDFLWQIIYERNAGGSTCKYLHFNDHSQRLSVDWAFQAWAEKALDEIEETCKSMSVPAPSSSS